MEYIRVADKAAVTFEQDDYGCRWGGKFSWQMWMVPTMPSPISAPMLEVHWLKESLDGGIVTCPKHGSQNST